MRELLARYCDLMDDADFDGVGALFAGGALADEHGTVLAAGAEAVAGFYRRSVILHDGSPRTTHLTLQPVVEVQGDEATGRSRYLVLQQPPGEPVRPMITGRYADRFRRGDDGWSFVERRFSVDLLGDLSQHLRLAL